MLCRLIFGVTGELSSFAFTFRLLPILGDLLSGLVLFDLICREGGSRRKAWLASLVLALNPASVAISGYHGNLDCLVGGVTLAALHRLIAHRDALGSGLLMGVALSLKLLPVVLVIVFLCLLPRAMLGRYLAGLIPAALPFIGYAGLTEGALIRNVFGYTAVPEYWGLPALVAIIGAALPAWQEDVPRLLLELNVYLGRAIPLLVAAVCLYWRPPLTVGITVACLVFAVFAGGWGVQYFGFLIPVLLATTLRVGVVSATAASVLVPYVYLSWGEPGLPLRSVHRGPFSPEVAAVGLVVWILLALMLMGLRREMPHPNRVSRAAVPRQSPDDPLHG